MTLGMSGARADDAGLASGLFNTTQQIGGCARPRGPGHPGGVPHRHAGRAGGEGRAEALTGGYHLAFGVAAAFVAAFTVAFHRAAAGGGDGTRRVRRWRRPTCAASRPRRDTQVWRLSTRANRAVTDAEPRSAQLGSGRAASRHRTRRRPPRASTASTELRGLIGHTKGGGAGAGADTGRQLPAGRPPTGGRLTGLRGCMPRSRLRDRLQVVDHGEPVAQRAPPAPGAGWPPGGRLLAADQQGRPHVRRGRSRVRPPPRRRGRRTGPAPATPPGRTPPTGRCHDRSGGWPDGVQRGARPLGRGRRDRCRCPAPGCRRGTPSARTGPRSSQTSSTPGWASRSPSMARRC